MTPDRKIPLHLLPYLSHIQTTQCIRSKRASTACYAALNITVSHDTHPRPHTHHVEARAISSASPTPSSHSSTLSSSPPFHPSNNDLHIRFPTPSLHHRPDLRIEIPVRDLIKLGFVLDPNSRMFISDSSHCQETWKENRLPGGL